MHPSLACPSGGSFSICSSPLPSDHEGRRRHQLAIFLLSVCPCLEYPFVSAPPLVPCCSPCLIRVLARSVRSVLPFGVFLDFLISRAFEVEECVTCTGQARRTTMPLRMINNVIRNVAFVSRTRKRIFCGLGGGRGDCAPTLLTEPSKPLRQSLY